MPEKAKKPCCPFLNCCKNILQKVQGKKNFLIIILLVSIIFLLGIIFSLLIISKKSSKKTAKFKSEAQEAKTYQTQTQTIDVPLPQTGNISAYIQTQYYDLDDDGLEEGIAIYRDSGDGDIYWPYFAVFKYENGQWNQILEQRLESYTHRDKTQSATDTGIDRNGFELIEVTNDHIDDVFIKTQGEGSGRWFASLACGFANGEIKILWGAGPIPHGESGTEGKKIWVLAPAPEPDDPNCCPSNWVKTWYQWNNSEFEEIGDYTAGDIKHVRNKKYSAKQKLSIGFIEGSLGYPSEGIPSDMEICAQNLETKKMYCTTDHLKSSKYTYKIGYKLEVSAGKYYVFAMTSSFGEPGYKAYYSAFVDCGMRDKCRSHTPISVTVSEGEITSGIDPIDWYN